MNSCLSGFALTDYLKCLKSHCCAVLLFCVKRVFSSVNLLKSNDVHGSAYTTVTMYCFSKPIATALHCQMHSKI
jgi:hypothetical protein